jgi:hypothetical protein
MALFDDMLEGGLGTGIVAALGVAVLGPVVAPVLRSGAKLAIRGGLTAYDWGRHYMAELGEMAGDLAAEVRTDMASSEGSHGGGSRGSKAS